MTAGSKSVGPPRFASTYPSKYASNLDKDSQGLIEYRLDDRMMAGVRVPGRFDELGVGQVASLGAAAVDEAGLKAFCDAFAPSWDIEDGAPHALVFAIWAKLDGEASSRWPQTKRLGVDALRFMRNPPAGELLRGRMTVFAKDAVGEDKGVVIAQHDLLDEAGRLVFSCLTRSVFSR